MPHDKKSKNEIDETGTGYFLGQIFFSLACDKTLSAYHTRDPYKALSPERSSHIPSSS